MILELIITVLLTVWLVAGMFVNKCMLDSYKEEEKELSEVERFEVAFVAIFFGAIILLYYKIDKMLNKDE